MQLGVLGTDADGVKLYSYDSYNRLKTYTDGVIYASYTYDGNNLRQSKTVNCVTTNHIWDGSNMVMEIKGTTVNKYYRGATGLMYSDIDGERRYYHKDEHGNVAAMTNAAGNVINVNTYDAFGNMTQTNESITDPFGYCGEYYDTELDALYLRNRYYSPSIGRFITEDPIKDGLNWYAYCGNNPIMFVDPSGMLPTMLRYAIEKVDGSISYDETTGTATVTFNGKTVEYSGEVINGRMIVDSADIARDLNISETYILHNVDDEFYSTDDAAMAFGLVYNISSTLDDGVEVQSYIYENSNGSYSYADVAIGVDLGNGFRTVYAPEPAKDRILIAWAHTHGPYPDPKNPDVALDLFTGRNEIYDDAGNLNSIIGDGSYSYSLQAGGYVFTPGGQFKYLNYSQWEEKSTTWIQDDDPAVRTISTSFPVSR